jgi:hypothetical protein
MGANAQIAVPAFTAGQILTAAQQTQINTGIPVFATTVTRDAAFGGAGEKTLAEGQFAFLEDTNTTQYYDGAAWQSVGVTPGMVLVKSQTIGTTVGSVAVTDAFSATYDAYKIVITGGVTSAAAAILRLTLGATVTNYYWAQNGRTFADADASGASGGASVAWRAGGGSPKILNMNIEIVGPFLTEETYFTGQYMFPTTTGTILNVAGFLDNTTSYTGFTVTPDSGTLTGGTIRVYGYANS